MENGPYFDLIRGESKKIGLELSKDGINKFETYLLELTKWNKKINLTGHKEDRYIIANLFIDSLAFHKALKSELVCSVLDIGSGAGFPGVPLKISKPNISLTLVEPNLKKVSFLHHIIGTLNLKNVEVEAKRIEDIQNMGNFTKSYQWIILKALRFDVCLPYVRPLLVEGGKVVVSRAKEKGNNIGLEGFKIQDEVSYQLPFGFGERELIVLSPSLI
jgi:16S rRNA (guanine527-N7)-methyltransferase